MKELVRTNDLVFLSWLQAVLKAEGIEPILLDTHASVMQGSLYAIARRLMIDDAEYQRARRIVTDAGEGDRLRPV